MSITAKVWSGDNRVSCSGCGKSIVTGEVYIAEDWQTTIPPAYCMRCGLTRLLATLIEGPTDSTLKRTLAELCKAPVREELHKIIREECTDPNGPISPGPTP